MKHTGWGFGLAAAGMVLMASHAQAQTGSSSGTSGSNHGSGYGSSTSSSPHDSSQGSLGSSPRDSTGSTGSTSMGSGSNSMGMGSSGMGTGSSSGSTASNEPSSGTAIGHFDALSGKVQSFDRSNNTLTLSGSPKMLKVDPGTQVTKDGERASIDDIKEGDQVRASFSGTGDTPHVEAIDITSKGSTSGSETSGSSSATEPRSPSSPGSGSYGSPSSPGSGTSSGSR